MNADPTTNVASDRETPLPSVDVLIPVRDRARFIAACLDSVRAQTLQPSTVIVVDDGSTDDTPDILAQYAARWPKLHIIRSVPRGVSHARNLAMAAARAPFVAFLDSDDVWLPEKLARQMSLFTAERPQIGFVHCGLIQIDETGKPLRGGQIDSPSKRGDVFRPMVENFYNILGSASAVVARRELVLSAGGFDETLTCGEDIDLWLKLARVSHVDYVAEPFVRLRVHSDNTCNRAVLINPELVLFQRLKIWNKWARNITDNSAVLDTFRREAVTVEIANLLKRNPDFGLYGRLKASDLELARNLFGSAWDYLRTAARSSLGPRLAFDRLKFVAARLIVRRPFLLRVFRMLGRFKAPS